MNSTKSQIHKVRISGGELRGRVIATPGGGTHPMGERERLALFNMIREDIPGATVLDVFAGSGALGIEALSRGASSACFVDNSSSAINTIKQNLTMLDALPKSKIIKGRIPDVIPSLSVCDIILADPPYDQFVATDIISLVSLLRDGGVLVLSHPGDAPDLSGAELVKSRKYAGATISIYRKV